MRRGPRVDIFNGKGRILTDQPAAPQSTTRRATNANLKDNQRAAFVRVALALFSAIALPFYFPEHDQYVWVSLAYLTGAVAFQLAIARDFGGIWRVLLGGCMDLAFLTYVVHRSGTQSTTLVSAYLLIGMFNGLVAPAWVARTLAALGVVTYSTVVFCEASGFLRYAPDIPGIGFQPTFDSALRASLTLAALVVVSTRVSDLMARGLREREQQLRAVNVRLEELSQRDPLTQLFNRRHFVHRATEELGRVRRGHPMVLLMMDLDGFKHINDEQGHLAGDDLLRKIARVIEESTRSVDIVGRFGGDEFVAMLPDTDMEQAGIVAERLVATVRDVGTEADPKRPVTISIGLTAARPEDDVTVLINAADDAAYRAKQAGGNRFAVNATQSSEIRALDSGPRAARTG
jgi:diguanylate cyclase (GGDEF)-like protein